MFEISPVKPFALLRKWGGKKEQRIVKGIYEMQQSDKFAWLESKN